MLSDSTRPKNRFILAAAGAGKTTRLVEEALAVREGRVLITTFTEANEAEIASRLSARRGAIPSNIALHTWFSFLLRHGVAPYQGRILDGDVRGMLLVNARSDPFAPESEPQRHYLTRDRRMYSDKIAKFVVRCNEAAGGRVIDRLARIYTHIFIDEAQDLAGYDLDILRFLLTSPMKVLAVGDPRQTVYQTHHEPRLARYAWGGVLSYVRDHCAGLGCEVDSVSLSCSFRCHPDICSLSNELYPALPSTSSSQCENTGHDGVFVVRAPDVDRYLKRFTAVQLRRDARVVVSKAAPTLNFGQSKGLGFDRVLIYPTEKMRSWLQDRTTSLPPKTRAHLYVALTRARHSAGIVWDETCPANTSLPTWRCGAPDA